MILIYVHRYVCHITGLQVPSIWFCSDLNSHLKNIVRSCLQQNQYKIIIYTKIPS